MTEITLAAAAAVDKGVALLDEKVPDWRSKVNLSTFNILSRSRCILGQVFMDYDEGMEFLFPDIDPALDDPRQYEYGFCPGRIDDVYVDARYLESEWRLRIAP